MLEECIRQRHESRLYLGVTVCAQQDALAGLGAKPLDTVRPALCQAERLIGWVDVVELQRCDTAIVCAEAAASACLRDEDPLDPAASAHNRLRTTLPTSV